VKFANDKQRRAVMAQLRGGRRQAQALPAARAALMLQHQGLLHAVARRFRGVSSSYEDLIGAGQIGLLHAAKGYRPQRGTRFSTYAVPHIRARMQRALAQEKTVKVGEKGLRAARRNPRTGSKILPFAVPLDEAKGMSSEGGIARAHARASLARIRRRADTLAPKLRRVFLTRYFSNGHARPEPWTTRKVAATLKLSLASVNKYEKLARQQLFGIRTTRRRRTI